MLKKIFSHTFIYGLTPYIVQIASLFTMPVLTKYLTPEDFGIWGVINAYIGILNGISMLGLNIILYNSFYKSPRHYQWLWKEIYGILTYWFVIYAALVIGLLYAIMPKEIGDNKNLVLFLVASPMVLMGPVSGMGVLFFQLKRKPTQIAVRTVCAGLLTIGLNLYTIAYLKMGYLGWAWSSFASTLLLKISYWYPINITYGMRPILKLKWRRILSKLKISLPTIPHTYSSYMINGATRVVMERSSIPIGDIGQYNCAGNFYNYVHNFAQASNTAINPFLLELYKKKKFTAARNLVYLWFTIFLSLTFNVSIWFKEIFSLLIKNDILKTAYPVAIILTMACNYRPIYIGCNQPLFYFEKTSQLWKISFIAGILAVLCNVIALRFFGYEASAVVTYFALMYMGYSGFLLKEHPKVNPVHFYPILLFLTTLVATVLAYLLVEEALSLKIGVSLFTLIIALIFFRILNKKDLGDAS